MIWQALQRQTDYGQPANQHAAALRPRFSLAAALLCALLSGCAGDGADATGSTNKPFPNLAEVPARPVTTPAAERQRLMGELTRDRDAAQAIRSAN